MFTTIPICVALVLQLIHVLLLASCECGSVRVRLRRIRFLAAVWSVCTAAYCLLMANNINGLWPQFCVMISLLVFEAYEVKPLASSLICTDRRATLLGLLFSMLVYLLVVGLGFWYEFHHRPGFLWTEAIVLHCTLAIIAWYLRVTRASQAASVAALNELAYGSTITAAMSLLTVPLIEGYADIYYVLQLFFTLSFLGLVQSRRLRVAHRVAHKDRPIATHDNTLDEARAMRRRPGNLPWHPWLPEKYEWILRESSEEPTEELMVELQLPTPPLEAHLPKRMAP